MTTMHYILQSPAWLLALLLIPAVWLARRWRRLDAWVVPFAAAWHRRVAVGFSRWPVVWVSLGAALLITGLARPQRVDARKTVQGEGYDIMLAVDLSPSMLAEDFEREGARINRLETIAPVIKAFINERRNDRIGITVFAGRAYTLAPLTFNHAWLARQVERLHTGLIEDGTAIGDGLGVALSRLEQRARTQGEKRKGALVILLTEGANNRGVLTPEQATELAKAREIPVYTIGVGRTGMVLMPVFDREGNPTTRRHRRRVELDEETLRKIAKQTGGQYFHAGETGTVEAAFRAIDQAEKIEFKTQSFLTTTELFPWLVWPGVAAVALGALWPGRRERTEKIRGSQEGFSAK